MQLDEHGPRLGPHGADRHRRCAGFSYIALLILIAIMGFGLASAATVWHTAAQREKETQLLFVGKQYSDAIQRYYQAWPGQGPRFPQQLSDLLQDERNGLVVKRHLRRLYPDPISGGEEWGLVRAGEEGILGVFSLGPGVPLRKHDLPFPEAGESYADWKFVMAVPAAPTQPGGGLTTPAGGGLPLLPGVAPGGPAVARPVVARQLTCEDVRARDESTCHQVEVKYDAAEAFDCYQSMAERTIACAQSGPSNLPGLIYNP